MYLLKDYISFQNKNSKEIDELLKDYEDYLKYLHLEKNRIYEILMEDVFGGNVYHDLPVSGLKEGEKLILPGGYTALPSGHAMLYVIEKQKGNKYAFKVMNTGDGISAHQSIESD